MAKIIRVMVAEDFPLLREDFCDVVSAQSDMEVVGSAASGEEIASLADTVPCDVILMDIEMETIDAGIRAAEVITARHPEVKILFLTAHETDDMITSAMGTGAVDYVVSQGLLSGSSRSHFSPEQPLNRAMLAQVLFQLAGQPDGGLTHFTDVPDTAWCYSAVSWAVSRDIMSGVDGETFAPERPPTRQELALNLVLPAMVFRPGTDVTHGECQQVGGDGCVGNASGAGAHEDLGLGVVFLHDGGQALLHIQADLVVGEGQAVVAVDGALDAAGPGEGLVRAEEHRLDFQQVFRDLQLVVHSLCLLIPQIRSRSVHRRPPGRRRR